MANKFDHQLTRRERQIMDVIYQRGQHIRVTCHQPLPVEVDGELFGKTPVDYAILPRAARFVVGPELP